MVDWAIFWTGIGAVAATAAAAPPIIHSLRRNPNVTPEAIREVVENVKTRQIEAGKFPDQKISPPGCTTSDSPLRANFDGIRVPLLSRRCCYRQDARFVTAEVGAIKRLGGGRAEVRITTTTHRPEQSLDTQEPIPDTGLYTEEEIWTVQQDGEKILVHDIVST